MAWDAAIPAPSPPVIIDAHHHFLNPAEIDYPFLRFLPDLARPLGPDELAPLVRAAGVDATVCVQAADALAETDFLLAQAARADWVAGVVGWVPLADPPAAARALERYVAPGSRLRGIRHLIHDEPDPDWVAQPRVLESLALLAERGLVFDLSAFSARHLSHVPTLAERVPELRVVICHFGMPRVDQGEWEPWASTFARAAQHANCSVKISGLDLFLGGPDAAKIQRYVDHALACFGPERLIWASNWPVSQGSRRSRPTRSEPQVSEGGPPHGGLRGYRELLDTGRAVLAGCSAAERAAVLGGNANRVYQLGLGREP
jgi:L-fuconolactonase